MRIVATTPHADAFIVEVDDRGTFVLDRRRRAMLPAIGTDSVLARGAWIEFKGDARPLIELAERLLKDGEDTGKSSSPGGAE